MMLSSAARPAALILCGLFGIPALLTAKELAYECTDPPLEVTFAVAGGHYSGVVTGGNLFLQPDISDAPVVRWKKAAAGKFYTLMMLDFDGNANGSWPDPVPSGENSPVRHWIVGNIPGDVLRGPGYVESEKNPANGKPTVLQSYRAPHIPMVSDRYGLYLFEQAKEIDFARGDGADHKLRLQEIPSNVSTWKVQRPPTFSWRSTHRNLRSLERHSMGTMSPKRGTRTTARASSPNNMSEDIHRLLLEASHAGEACALATVAKVTGSAPREAGTKMVIFEDGRIAGTIGGGKFESLVIEEAQKAMTTGEADLENLPAARSQRRIVRRNLWRRSDRFHRATSASAAFLPYRRRALRAGPRKIRFRMWFCSHGAR